MTLSNKDSFDKSFDNKSSFISEDKKSLFILFELNPESVSDSENLLNLIHSILFKKDQKLAFAGRVPSEIYFQEKSQMVYSLQY